jgi:glucokinase
MEKNLITLKEINKKNILKIIIRNEKISRTDIAKFFKISRPTISSYINEMINEGLVEEAGKSSSTPSGGKRATLLKFNSSAGYIISISIGTNLLRFAITDLGTNIIDSMAIPTEE